VNTRRATLGCLASIGLYLVLPGHQVSWLNGLPLAPLPLSLVLLGAVAIFVAWPLTGVPRLEGVRAKLLLGLLALLCGLKMLAWLAAPTYGLEARYFTRPGANVQPERSTEHGRPGITRLDDKLSFAGDEFPLYFFNDNVRFNYYQEDEPDRATLPFIATWQGWLDVPREGSYRVWLTAVGAASLDLPGGLELQVESADDTSAATIERQVELARGRQQISVRYSRPRDGEALLLVEWDGSGARAPLAGQELLSTEARLPGVPASLALWVARTSDSLVLLTWLAVIVALLVAGLRARSRERLVLGALLAAISLYAVVSTLPLHGRSVILEGGADWLTYETYARDIQLNGPLMPLGRPVGRGRPYFFQPFYPYVLAAYHWLTGEGIYGPIVLQLVGIGVAAVLVYYLARALFGRTVGWLSLATLVALLGPFQLDWVARHLLSENVYFYLVPATALAFIQLLRRPDRMTAVAAGSLLGLCCLTRGPTLLWAPACFGLSWWAWRRACPARAGLGRSLLLALAVFLSVYALVPLRNLVVSGQLVFTATNGVATMELAHPVPPHVRLDGVEKQPLYRALRLDFAVIQMIEFVRQDPLGYWDTLWPLGLYALGLPSWLEPDSSVRWELVGLVVLYLANLAGLRSNQRDPNDATRAGRLLLHSFIGLHLLMMMVFLPNVYGYRQVLPMYLFVVIFAAEAFVVGLERLGLGVRRVARQQRGDDQDRGRVDQGVERARASP
jgi:hypothetical protein